MEAFSLGHGWGFSSNLTLGLGYRVYLETGEIPKLWFLGFISLILGLCLRGLQMELGFRIFGCIPSEYPLMRVLAQVFAARSERERLA